MSEERCELSELPVGQCGCRIHGLQEEAPPTGALTGYAFAARFAGQCRECREDIDVGDDICASPLAGGGYVHAECS